MPTQGPGNVSAVLAPPAEPSFAQANSVQDLVELTAIGANLRKDQQNRYVEDEERDYAFDADSTTTPSSPQVMLPDDLIVANPGRWHRRGPGSAGALPAAHDFAGAEHTADTFADVDAKISDATLVAEVENTATTTDATLTTIATIAIPDDTVVLLEVRVVGRRTDAAGQATYIRRAVVFREAAGSAVILGQVNTPLTRESSGNAPWKATIAVSGNNALVQVTGQAAKTVNWKSLHRTRQVA